MLKYIGLLCGVLMVVSACGAKSETAPQEDPTDALKRSLANYSNACTDVAFPQTIAKLGEADKYKEEGNAAESRKAGDEAVELFKAEEPKYIELNNANEAQNSRLGEITTRRDSIDADMAAAAGDPKSAEAVQKWQEALPVVNQHIENAKAAYVACDPAKAQAELDAASAILDEFAGQTIVVEEDVAVAMEGKVYTVKKGDCLWNIAGAEYSNPFMWPIIYWANKSQINDPDLIFPGQNFDIIFDFAEADQIKATEFAKTRGPWSLYDNK